MSRTSLCLLPFDICDRVLTLLPDFLSLQSAVLSSKHLYETYLPRKRSIVHAVEINEVGPALTFSVALVRTMKDLGKKPLQDILGGLNNPDLDSTYWTTDVTAEEARTLSGISAAVQRLESWFCVLYKDAGAPVSNLSDEESFRFHRAIYRTWILGVLEMSDEELVEMHEVIPFLDELVRFSIIRDARDQGYIQPPMRPLQLRLDDLLAHLDGNTNIRTFGYPLTRSGSAIINTYSSLAKERQIGKLLSEKHKSGKVILTSTKFDVFHACQRCNRRTKSNLFGQNNWHILHLILHPEGLFNYLPGKLNNNAHIQNGTRALFEHLSSYAPVISEMFDCQNDPESNWKKNDWICIECIKSFVKERFFSWLVSELIKNGHQFKENCWYGWNCRTQTHRLEHAMKLNHLCEPTDRDDTINNANVDVGEVENITEDGE